MSNKILASAALFISFAVATGCSGGASLQPQVDELTREKEDLERQNQLLEGKLAASEAKCDAFERDPARRTGVRTGERTNEYQLPEDLKETGVNMSRRGSDTVIEIPSDLFFASGSSTINGQGSHILDKVAQVLKKQHSSALIRVEGHTDSDPIRKTKNKYHCNFDLGFERAHQVAHYLVSKSGIDEKRIVCDSFGDHQPQDPRNKAKNRRVEIVIAQ